VVVDNRDETSTARTLVLHVPGWEGHLGGQHVDVRLTAEDGYATERSYSIAAPARGERVELTIELVAEGEVSPFLVRELRIGDAIELRGPVGGWFVWSPERSDPLLLIGGGSGVVPLVAIARAHAAADSPAPLHLIYSLRSLEGMYYRDELHRETVDGDGIDLTLAFTRHPPEGWPRPARRLTLADLRELASPLPGQVSYVCGPTAFVEAVAGMLVELGHEPGSIRTERFGPTGG
jgi:ferredoxin-NADP reductase